MRATRVLLASGVVIFAISFFDAFALRNERADVGGRVALGAFEFFGAVVSLYLLSKGRPGNASLLDWSGCASAILAAGMGLHRLFNRPVCFLPICPRSPGSEHESRWHRGCRSSGTGGLGAAGFFKNLFRAVASRRRCRRMVGKSLCARSVLERDRRQHPERTRCRNSRAMRVISQSVVGILVLGNAFDAAQAILAEKRHLYRPGRSANSIRI